MTNPIAQLPHHIPQASRTRNVTSESEQLCEAAGARRQVPVDAACAYINPGWRAKARTYDVDRLSLSQLIDQRNDLLRPTSRER